ncbi:hypothetical protein BSLA_02r4170 [Burkholderia stabilis]|nr:hypothetical protein BSLA_02r4170 [Burkholderia stabilis]
MTPYAVRLDRGLLGVATRMARVGSKRRWTGDAREIARSRTRH